MLRRTSVFQSTAIGSRRLRIMLKVEDELGWEVDAKLKYALAKNLTYQIDAGYFDAGDFYGRMTQKVLQFSDMHLHSASKDRNA